MGAYAFDDSLQALAFDLEAAGLGEYAARLSDIIEHDPHVLPQVAEPAGVAAQDDPSPIFDQLVDEEAAQ